MSGLGAFFNGKDGKSGDGSVKTILQKNVRPLIKKNAKKTIKKAWHYISKSYLSGQIESFLLDAPHQYATFCVNTWININFGG